MTDRGIIFGAPMVCALLAGRKGMTRRLLKRPGALAVADAWGGKTMSLPENADLLPYAVGDRLWVRETWQIPALCDIQFRASDTMRIGHWNPETGPWRSPIHMPRKFSRLTLTVIGVKVERLQEISEEDAMSEGITDSWPEIECNSDRPYREAFCWLWNSLHGPTAWAANPWVVAVSFSVERKNIDA